MCQIAQQIYTFQLAFQCTVHFRKMAKIFGISASENPHTENIVENRLNLLSAGKCFKNFRRKIEKGHLTDVANVFGYQSLLIDYEVMMTRPKDQDPPPPSDLSS